MSALAQLADALHDAQKKGFTVTWGEYAHGIEYVRVSNNKRYIQHAISTNSEERNATSAIMRFISSGVRCPRCERLNPQLSHGELCRCKCGLTIQRFGNALEVWE